MTKLYPSQSQIALFHRWKAQLVTGGIIYILIAGDLSTLAVVTVVGFATHGEAGLSLLPRMLTSFIPLSLGWFLIAPFLGLFYPRINADARQLWRPPLAMLFAGPLAALLRALLLNSVVIPIFGLVLSGSAGLGMLAWRWLWWLIQSKTTRNSPSL